MYYCKRQVLIVKRRLYDFTNNIRKVMTESLWLIYMANNNENNFIMKIGCTLEFYLCIKK